MNEPAMPNPAEKPPITWEFLQDRLAEFGNKIIDRLDILGINHEAAGLDIDHACVRFETNAQVEKLLADLAEHGEVVSEALISNRIINTFRLNQPLIINGKKVKYLEIPNPKENHKYEDGWEHVEFVLDNVEENTEEGIVEAFFAKFPHLSRQHLEENYEFKVNTPQVKGEQTPNPTVGLIVDGIGLKFHANSIGKVINDPKYED